MEKKMKKLEKTPIKTWPKMKLQNSSPKLLLVNCTKVLKNLNGSATQMEKKLKACQAKLAKKFGAIKPKTKAARSKVNTKPAPGVVGAAKKAPTPKQRQIKNGQRNESADRRRQSSPTPAWKKCKLSPEEDRIFRAKLAIALGTDSWMKESKDEEKATTFASKASFASVSDPVPLYPPPDEIIEFQMSELLSIMAPQPQENGSIIFDNLVDNAEVNLGFLDTALPVIANVENHIETENFVPATVEIENDVNMNSEDNVIVPEANVLLPPSPATPVDMTYDDERLVLEDSPASNEEWFSPSQEFPEIPVDNPSLSFHTPPETPLPAEEDYFYF